MLGVVRSACTDFEIRRAKSVTDVINGRKERQGRFVVPPPANIFSAMARGDIRA
jgi:hypothetical protein